MGALTNFLARDPAARAVVFAVLAAGLPGVAAAKPAPVAAPKIETPSRTVSEESILVALMGADASLGQVTGLMRDSLTRCLTDQGRLLSTVAKGGSTAASAKEIKAAVAVRRDQLRDEDSDDVTVRTFRLMHEGGTLTPDQAVEGLRHSRLRYVCLDWSKRTVADLEGKLKAGKPQELAEALDAARSAAGHDLESLGRLASTAVEPTGFDEMGTGRAPGR